jgi:hypothetical protein
MRIPLLTFFLLAASLSSGFAQSSGTTKTLTSGDVDSGFLIAPDFKFTDINGDFANLAGAYGGWVIDKKFMIGGGVYTLTNGDSSDMTYGGGVFEYFVNQGSLVNVSVRGLVGGGSASFENDFPFHFDVRGIGRGAGVDFGGRGNPGRGGFGNLGNIDIDSIVNPVGGFLDLDALDFFDDETSTSFFIAEPEVNVNVNISERVRFAVGGSYRFIGGAGRLNNRLDGFAATVALKFTFF